MSSLERGAPVPLVVATRGEAVESVHSGMVVVADAEGRMVHALGDPAAVVFARSTLKPFQARALVAHAGFPGLGLTPAEIAVCCGSHSGEPRHAEAVLGILAKAEQRKEDLRCGVHPPLYLEALGERPMREDRYTPLHNNCSGKHAGMLALARLLEAPAGDYLEPEGPVQRAVRSGVADAAGLVPGALTAAVDGCGAPTWALALGALARAYAGLATAGEGEADPLGAIFDAMAAHPEMVSGLKRPDLALTMAGRGDWVSKCGAEGVQAIAVRSRGWGIALKVADGAARARDVAAVAIMHQLGLLDAAADPALAGFARPPILNCRGETVGALQPVFELADAGAGDAPPA